MPRPSTSPPGPVHHNPPDPFTLHLSDRGLTVLLAHSVSRVVNLSLLVYISLSISIFLSLSLYPVPRSRSRSRSRPFKLYFPFP
jgi:hypothetical protein